MAKRECIDILEKWEGALLRLGAILPEYLRGKYEAAEDFALGTQFQLWKLMDQGIISMAQYEKGKGLLEQIAVATHKREPLGVVDQVMYPLKWEVVYPALIDSIGECECAEAKAIESELGEEALKKILGEERYRKFRGK